MTEYVVSKKEQLNIYRGTGATLVGLRRRTGQTTAGIFELLAKAIKNQGIPIQITDHATPEGHNHYYHNISHYVVPLIEEMIQKLEFKGFEIFKTQHSPHFYIRLNMFEPVSKEEYEAIDNAG